MLWSSGAVLNIPVAQCSAGARPPQGDLHLLRISQETRVPSKKSVKSRILLNFDQDCLKSIFKLHNETVNIWTHLLGFIIFFCLMMKDVAWHQDHIRDGSDFTATIIQLMTYQVNNSIFKILSSNNTFCLVSGVYAIKHCISYHVLPWLQTVVEQAGPGLHTPRSLWYLRQSHHQQLSVFPSIQSSSPSNSHHSLRNCSLL